VQRQEASILLNQQSHITNLQAYQMLARLTDTSFCPFQVNEEVLPPWPNRISIIPTTYNYTSPGMPRQMVSVAESYTPQIAPLHESYTP
jgi:hypothetical protein